MVESLLKTEQTAVSDEDLEVVVGEEVLLGEPGLEDHVTGQVRHLLPGPLPDQPEESHQDHLHLLLSHPTRLDGGPGPASSGGEETEDDLLCSECLQSLTCWGRGRRGSEEQQQVNSAPEDLSQL